MSTSTDPSPDQLAAATRIIRALTGRRWTFPRKQVVEEYWVPETVSSVTLVGRPVSGVNSVVDRQGNVYDYILSDRTRLRIPVLERRPWPFGVYPNYDSNGGVYPFGHLRGVHLTIDYIYGSRPPVDVRMAINELAVQFRAADVGGTCKLPERVTSINREGVSWTVIDPQEFLKDGRVGLYFVDLVISTYGNKPRQRARVFSPEYSPPRRLSSQLLTQDFVDGLSP